MEKSPQERRQHARVYRHFILNYHQKGKAMSVQVSQVNNVSLGGMSFSSTRPLKEDSVIIIDLQTPFLADALNLEGVVLESKEKIADMIYEIRIKFQGLTGQQLEILKKIESYAKSNA